MRQPPAEALVDWVGRQRWFGGAVPTASSVTLAELASVTVEDGLEVGWWVLSTAPADAHGCALLLAMACCRGPAPVEDSLCSGDLRWFDALRHPATARHALNLLGSGGRPGIEAVWLDEHPLVLADAGAGSGDQSNSSVFTAAHVLKVFRRLQPGRNPEIELGAALRAADSTHVAPLSGWATAHTPDGAYDILAVHRRVDAADGFTLAVADAARFARGADELHFPGAAYELGITLGAVHADLVESFGERLVPGYAAQLSRRLLTRLEALSDVTVLAGYLPNAAALFTDLASTNDPMVVHRVHGDLHLGQTLFTDEGWRLIDFEGEPRRPLAERAAPDTPLRDVAGMLRSFDYAARWSGPGSTVADAWPTRAAAMFLEGYQLQRPASVHTRALNALVLDKALYEVGYEAAYRPDRLRIPLAAVAALCGR